MRAVKPVYVIITCKNDNNLWSCSSFVCAVGACADRLFSCFLSGRTFPVDQFFLEDAIALTRCEIHTFSGVFGWGG